MGEAFGTPVSVAITLRDLLYALDSVVHFIFQTGFDRDLGIAGRVMVRESDGSIVQKLVKIDRPSMHSFSP